MAHYNFRKDLEQSQIGVGVVKEHIVRSVAYDTIENLERDRQHEGDLEIMLDDTPCTIEVKYDMMAENTGNLCFEASNGKKATGQADEVWYVVPDGDSFDIYKFETTKLVSFLNNPVNSDKIKVVNGGDRRKFILMLMKKDLAEKLISYDVVRVADA